MSGSNPTEGCSNAIMPGLLAPLLVGYERRNERYEAFSLHAATHIIS